LCKNFDIENFKNRLFGLALCGEVVMDLSGCDDAVVDCLVDQFDTALLDIFAPLTEMTVRQRVHQP
jgi:hypothetical protein